MTSQPPATQPETKSLETQELSSENPTLALPHESPEKHTPESTDQPPENPGRSGPRMLHVEPNHMSYADGDGIQHLIHLPKGTAQQAGRLLKEENWGELAKYPASNGQKYSPEDYFYPSEEPT
ncbi:hypothetical protein HYQ46_004359 [Verticillium longisporum]|nr:hypothetical protein HYQ46_004359 [Verticillium longisporum]